MANEKFTTGPWFKVGESRNLANNVSSHRIDALDGQLCIAYVTDYTSKEACDANAALIAAAPAMYEALKSCKHIAEMLQSGFDEDNSEYQMLAGCLKEIEAALAAANPETINT